MLYRLQPSTTNRVFTTFCSCIASLRPCSSHLPYADFTQGRYTRRTIRVLCIHEVSHTWATLALHVDAFPHKHPSLSSHLPHWADSTQVRSYNWHSPSWHTRLDGTRTQFIMPIYTTTPGPSPSCTALQRNTPATAGWLAPTVSMLIAHLHIP